MNNSSWLISLISFLLLWSNQGVLSDGNIGCLFNKDLCVDEIEWCYDDFVFGRCLQGTVESDDLYRYEFLSPEQLDIIENELKRLLDWNYSWSHPYTQCRLQAILFAFKNDLPFNPYECHHLMDKEIQLADEITDNIIDPLAVVQFMPSLSDPSATFADEVYYPPLDYEINPIENVMNGDLEPEQPVYTIDRSYDVQKKAFPDFGNELDFIPAMHRRTNAYEIDESIPNDRLLSQFVINEPYPMISDNDRDFSDRLTLSGSDIDTVLQQKWSDDAFKNRIALIREDMNDADSDSTNDDIPESRIYYDDLEQSSDEDDGDDDDDDDNSNIPSIIYPQNIKSSDLTDKFMQMLASSNIDNFNMVPGIFTEGGVVVMPDKHKLSANKMIDNWGFKRHERLDVKKPGPPFNEKIIIKMNAEDKKKKSLDGTFNADSFTHSLAHQRYDFDYAYVDLKNSIREWDEGRKIINQLAKMLHLNPNTFTNIIVDRNQVTFKVEPNLQRLNASQVAVALNNLRDDIKDKFDIEIISAGVGYKAKRQLTPIQEWLGSDEDLFVNKLVIGCVIAATLMACVTLCLVYRYAITRQKLQDIDAVITDSEASKDYQELCRSRMATKITTGTPPCPQTQIVEKSEAIHGRITSLSKESDQQSPSSRSSTSSWSEEPVLSNMDISTGHMVLSYMEDHLKNKDRLEQEWVALCAYEAEPCSVAIAQKPDNIEKNRYPHVLPYDHSRVILSSLSNLTDSDYINASSITDHDPRNPAYIATQGPMPNTAADFWQMVWEQGSVVMVMLTRLTENGRAMCHRYWPEEGSEVYHVYEVHLVSEHIWCDDYLVRSFYLKNMKTGETRTVTQFHFLSWPELGVPTSTKALLEFRRKVNKSYRGRSCPIIVHCSDGAGRTGTYCLIDMVLNRMSKGAKEIDIAATLEHIRDQRPAMVTTKQQFEFVLMAVAEEVHAILKALPAAIEKQQQLQQQQQQQQ